MPPCCENNCCSLNATHERQRKTLRFVLAINALMFFVIAAAAIVSHSSALLADSLDNFGDAVTYGLSLYAIKRSNRTKARVALFKGLFILAAALSVIAQVIYKITTPSLRIFELMGGFSLIGLLANSLCLFLLWRHRHEDINMSSVWECSQLGLYRSGRRLAGWLRLAGPAGGTCPVLPVAALGIPCHRFCLNAVARECLIVGARAAGKNHP